MRPLLLVLVAVLAVGCAGRVDRFLVERPIAEALKIPDLDLACRGGNGQVPVVSGLFEKKPAHRALAILEVTAAACSELAAMEAELEGERAAVLREGQAKVAAVKDARERERRLRGITAARLWRGWNHVEAAYGPIGEGECPKLKREMDELTYFMGLVAGASALLQDQASGGEVGVPQNVLGKVARGATCLNSADWWYAPDALKAGSWAMVPGSGPDGVDPWAALKNAAAEGDATGMRLARAMQVQVAANAGRETDVLDAIRAFAAVETEAEPRYVLLDAYATLIVRHHADLVWTRERGYRARALGDLPGDDAADVPVDDPFAGDPFAADPFAAPSDEGAGDDTDAPDDATEETP